MQMKRKCKREKAHHWCNRGEEDKFFWKMLSNGEISTAQRTMEILNKYPEIFGQFSDNVFRQNLLRVKKDFTHCKNVEQTAGMILYIILI